MSRFKRLFTPKPEPFPTAKKLKGRYRAILRSVKANGQEVQLKKLKLAQGFFIIDVQCNRKMLIKHHREFMDQTHLYRGMLWRFAGKVQSNFTQRYERAKRLANALFGEKK